MNWKKGNKQKDNKKGFTLVELVVVLVILAILMAILVPSLVGYIRKAKNQQAFAECRSCVIAAQSIASEKYGKDQTDKLDWGGEKYPDVKKMAEVPDESTIDKIETNDEKYLVTYLSYTTGNLTVIYEKGHNPEYYLQEEPDWSRDAKKDIEDYSGYEGYVKNYPGTYLDRWGAAQKLMDSLGKGLPEVSSSILNKTGYGNTPMYWRPYYIGSKNDPHVVYYANTSNGKDANGNWTTTNQWVASIAMIDGKIYYNPNGKNTNVGGSWNQAKTVDEARAALTDKGFIELK
ncbi:MAG: prepilin-type N-terminal cleavage/methylation domain-containing protein [Blautia sp.]